MNISTVSSNDKLCPHGTSLRFDCYQCAFDRVKNNHPGVCSHWIPKDQYCYACARLKDRENPFTERPYIPVTQQKPQSTFGNSYTFFEQQKGDSSNIYSPQVTAKFEGYINPEQSNKEFPQPINSFGGRYYPSTDPRRSMSVGREATHRSQYEQSKESKLGVFLDRSLDDSRFMASHQGGDMWGNPLIKRNFPSPMNEQVASTQPVNSDMVGSQSSQMYSGISSRKTRKLDFGGQNEDMFLKRSLIQPDMRHGNRFYEIMPETDRRQSYRQEDNVRSTQFQQQTAQIAADADFRSAYNSGAAMGRAGNPDYSYR